MIVGLKEKKVRFRSDSGIGIFQCLIGPSIVRGWNRVLYLRKGMCAVRAVVIE